MSDIGVRFENRDFEPYPHEHWEKLQPVKYSRSVFGGHKKATINAEGVSKDLWEFIEMLRCPVYFMDMNRAKDTWWGYVNRVAVWDGGMPWSVSLDHMANKVAIAYSFNFERFTTAWVENTDSSGEYGVKELLLTAREKNSTLAEQFRATELDARKFPTLDPGFGGKRRNKTQVRIDCKGWFSSLGWRYYSQDEGSETYEDFGSGEREIGEDDRPTAAQGFQLSSAAGWTASSIWLRVRKVGAPADNFQVALWDDDGGGLPNAQIEACAVLAGANITTSYAWYEFTLDSAQALALATQYWIHASRSGGVDADNFYMIDANKDQGYANGNLFIKPTGAWYDKNMDALFRVVGEADTATQLATIVTDAAEFIEGTDSGAGASGVSSGTYRAGDQTSLYEVMEILKSGSDDNRRLNAEITNIRKLRYWVEEAKYASDWTMNKDLEMWDLYGNKIPPEDCPVGHWFQLIDFIPSTVNISKLSDPSPVFVDEAEFNVLKNEYKILKTRSGVSAAESLTRSLRIG